MFSYLNFEEISINEYNNHTLKININLHSDSKNLIYILKGNNENLNFFSCKDCKILLPKDLLEKEHSQRISKNSDGWHCRLCNTSNNLKDFHCTSLICPGIIDKEVFESVSIIEKYYNAFNAIIKI